MALDDIKDRIQEQAVAFYGRLQESSAWNRLTEKYQDLSPNGQKGALAGVGALAALILFMIPYTFYSSSQSELKEFEDKKATIRDLYQTSRAANALPPSPGQIGISDLKSLVQNVLDTEHPVLLPEQKLSVIDLDTSKIPDLPKSLTRAGVLVNLGQLNLDQVVNIGSHLQALRPTVKLTSLNVRANVKDPHYFDVTLKLVALSLPAEAVAKPAPGKFGAKPSFNKPSTKD
jgi:hypothetical protein